MIKFLILDIKYLIKIVKQKKCTQDIQAKVILQSKTPEEIIDYKMKSPKQIMEDCLTESYVRNQQSN